MQRIEAGSEVTNKELVVDNAILLLTNADQFWNLGNLEVRKGLQDLIFPNGLRYSFAEGFGTVDLTESHLLIQKVTANDDLNPSLVRESWIDWNGFKKELIAFSDLCKLVR